MSNEEILAMIERGRERTKDVPKWIAISLEHRRKEMQAEYDACHAKYLEARRSRLADTNLFHMMDWQCRCGFPDKHVGKYAE